MSIFEVRRIIGHRGRPGAYEYSSIGRATAAEDQTWGTKSPHLSTRSLSQSLLGERQEKQSACLPTRIPVARGAIDTPPKQQWSQPPPPQCRHDISDALAVTATIRDSAHRFPQAPQCGGACMPHSIRFLQPFFMYSATRVKNQPICSLPAAYWAPCILGACRACPQMEVTPFENRTSWAIRKSFPKRGTDGIIVIRHQDHRTILIAYVALHSQYLPSPARRWKSHHSKEHILGYQEITFPSAALDGIIAVSGTKITAPIPHLISSSIFAATISRLSSVFILIFPNRPSLSIAFTAGGGILWSRSLSTIPSSRDFPLVSSSALMWVHLLASLLS